MAVQLDGGGKEDLKTQFVTREGTYKLMTLSEYSRPNRVGYTNSQGSASVRVSFVTLPDPADPTGAQGLGDRMCFNFGKELYVYVYRGVKKVSGTTRGSRDDTISRGETSSRPNLLCESLHLWGWFSSPRLLDVESSRVHRDHEGSLSGLLADGPGTAGSFYVRRCRRRMS